VSLHPPADPSGAARFHSFDVGHDEIIDFLKAFDVAPFVARHVRDMSTPLGSFRPIRLLEPDLYDERMSLGLKHTHATAIRQLIRGRVLQWIASTSAVFHDLD